MKDLLKKLPEQMQDILLQAGKVSSRLDMPVYLVGGVVRDLILGRENFDLDLVVEGDGIEFAKAVACERNAHLIVHKRFGTATISLAGHHKLDIATARLETYPHPAALPVVVPGKIEDDLKRRDFSINALAVSLNARDFGRLIDFHSGSNDLKEGLVRVLHDRSFIDDPLRILRAVRFSCRFDFPIEPHTLKLLKEALKEGGLEIVQPQRLRDDLILMLKEKDPYKGIKRLDELYGFSFLLEGFSPGKNTAELFKSSRMELAWFAVSFGHRRQPEAWLVYLLALIDSMGIKETQAFCRKFAFRRSEQKRILDYKGLSTHFLRELTKTGLKPERIYGLLEPVSYEGILALKAKFKSSLLQKRIVDFLEIYNGMRPFIRGEDLHGLGVAPGPLYKKVFAHVLSAKLNGEVSTREEELHLIHKLLKKRS